MLSLLDFRNLIREILDEGSYSMIKLLYQSKLTYRFQVQEGTTPSGIKKDQVCDKIGTRLIPMARQPIS